MKILYLHQYFNTPSMSGGTRSFEMAKRLVQEGHQVSMITSDREGTGNGWKVTEELGIRVHWYSARYSNTMGYAKRILAFLKFVFAAGRRSLDLEYDIVFATSTPLTIALPAVFAARRRRVPLVFEIRDLWPTVPIELGVLRNPLVIFAAERLERFAYRNSTRIIALAPGMKEHIAKTGIDPERITVVPNGCDTYLFNDETDARIPVPEHEAAQGGHPLVLYAGTMGLVNGTEWIVRIAETVGRLDPRIRIVMIGGGRKRDDTLALAKSTGVLGKNLFILPSVTKKELIPWLRHCDAAFVTMEGSKTYARDSVSNKFFDAISAGKPIFANHLGFSTGLAAEAGCAKILPADPTEAASILVETLSDRVWLGSAAIAARNLARTVFDRNAQAKELLGVLLDAERDPESIKRRKRGKTR